MNINKIRKKLKKSVLEEANVIFQSVFLRSQLRGKRGNPIRQEKERDDDWECSLKEWKDVANTQGFF